MFITSPPCSSASPAARASSSASHTLCAPSTRPSHTPASSPAFPAAHSDPGLAASFCDHDLAPRQSRSVRRPGLKPVTVVATGNSTGLRRGRSARRAQYRHQAPLWRLWTGRRSSQTASLTIRSVLAWRMQTQKAPSWWVPRSLTLFLSSCWSATARYHSRR